MQEENNNVSKNEPNQNGKIILIATVICLIIGVGFIFRVDKKIVDLFKNNKKPIVTNELTLPNLPNMVVISAGAFNKKEIKIKEGEVVSFYNNDSAIHKVIGKDIQTPNIEKTGAATIGDLKKGEYEFYVENLPKNVIKVIVK